jgi:hypothetical protein
MRSFVFETAEMSYYLAYVNTQMSEGTDATREEVLHEFLKQNEKRRGHPSALFDIGDRGFAMDAALTYARLAALAQKRGANQEAQQYLVRAASFCPQFGWKECSIEKISYMVKRLDKKGTFKTSGTK